MIGRLYDRQRWHRMRKHVLACTPWCEYCGERPSQHVDHIKPLDQGGAPYDRANMAACCIACHNQKTRADEAGRAWLRPRDRGCDVEGNPRVTSDRKTAGGVKSRQGFA